MPVLSYFFNFIDGSVNMQEPTFVNILAFKIAGYCKYSPQRLETIQILLNIFKAFGVMFIASGFPNPVMNTIRPVLSSSLMIRV